MNEYLTATRMNNLENKIELLYESFKNKFNIEFSNLKNIEIGDNLDSVILFLNFPSDLSNDINNQTSENIIISKNDIISVKLNNTIIGDRKYISDNYKSIAFKIMYGKNENELNPWCNSVRYKMSYDSGKVSYIDENNVAYNYIKIKDNDLIPLNFKKKIWTKNEIPYIQEIDRIEESIDMLASFFYKPFEYEKKQWLETEKFDTNIASYGTDQKNISINDFKRWEKNIKILNDSLNDEVNIWNLQSFINWNERSDYEWEEI